MGDRCERRGRCTDSRGDYTCFIDAPPGSPTAGAPVLAPVHACGLPRSRGALEPPRVASRITIVVEGGAALPFRALHGIVRRRHITAESALADSEPPCSTLGPPGFEPDGTGKRANNFRYLQTRFWLGDKLATKSVGQRGGQMLPC